MLVCSIPCALLEVVFEGESMLCHCCSLYHHVARCASSRRGRAPLHVSVSVISDQHLQSQSRFSKSVETRSAHDQNISWVVSTQRYTQCSSEVTLSLSPTKKQLCLHSIFLFSLLYSSTLTILKTCILKTLKLLTLTLKLTSFLHFSRLGRVTRTQVQDLSTSQEFNFSQPPPARFE